MAMGKHSCIAVLVAFAAACASTPPLLPPTPVPPTMSISALGPGDVFEVRVYDEKELSGVYRVASDGTIRFPLIGSIRLEGMTANEAGVALERELLRFIKQPHVSIFVKEHNSKKVFVFGEVKRPGTFVFEQDMNIIQAITLAGGFDKLADKNGTFVTRTVEGREERLRVSVKDIGEGRASNFRLEPGDIVYVPESIF